MAGGKFKATYITEQEFMDNYIYGFPHRFYEGFIIGVGYAYVACRMEHPPHQHGFSCCPDIHPEDNIYRTLHYQQIDNSPEMKELSLRGRESGEFTEIRVMVGDTLGGLAREFGVTVEDMVRWNKLDDPDKIIAGQSLMVKTDDERVLGKVIARNRKIAEPADRSVDWAEAALAANVSGAVNNFNGLNKFVSGAGIAGTFLQQSNLSFYITTGGEFVKFRGNAPKNATSLSKMGRNVGKSALVFTTVLDYAQYRKNNITGNKFIFNTSLNVVAYYNPYFGVIYGITELLYPGGFVQAINDRADLEAERRKAMGRMYLPLSAKSYF